MTSIDQGPIHRTWGRLTTQVPFIQTSPKPWHDDDGGSDVTTRTWNLGSGELPVISGASMRGRLRRVLVEDMLDRIGVEPGTLPVRAAHALLVGGSLKKGDKDDLSPEKVARLRALAPPFAILGGTALAGWVAGRLRAGSWVAQTDGTPQSLLHGHASGEGLTPIGACMMVERFAQHDELRAFFTLDQIKSAFGVTAPAPKVPAGDGAGDNDSSDAKIGALHGYRVVVPEVEFAGWMALGGYRGLTEDQDAVQRSCLRHGLELAFPHGEEITLGLRASAGYGVVVCEWENLDDIAPDGTQYQRYLEANKEEIREGLHEFNTIKAPKKPKGTSAAEGATAAPVQDGTREAGELEADE